MDIVQFVTIEDNDRLILSFSFKEGTQFGIEGFIIRRSPKLEVVLMPHERGPFTDWTEDDEVITVKKVNLSRKFITIKTQYDKYTFDISKVSEAEFKDIIKVLKKMNFDNIFKLKYSQ